MLDLLGLELSPWWFQSTWFPGIVPLSCLSSQPYSTTKFISSQKGAHRISQVSHLFTSPCSCDGRSDVTSWQIPQIPSRIHITLGFPWWQHGLELSFVGSFALRWLAPSLAAATWSPTTIWLQMALWRLQWFSNRSNQSDQVIWDLWLNLDTYVYA